MTEKPNFIGQLSLQYSKSPNIKALLKLVPGWSAADTLLQKRAEEIKNARTKAFFDELKKGEHILTEELISQDDFLHSYFCTLRAALNTRRTEKIALFARLLTSACNPSLRVIPEEHDELLAILDEISLREFFVLNELRNHEINNPLENEENPLQRVNKYWDEFRQTSIDKYQIPAESFNAFLAKLERTGLYLRITGAFLSYSGDKGMTTPLFDRLASLVKESK